MKSILVVTGSARPNSVNKEVVKYVKQNLENKNVKVAIADLKEMDLPFFDSPVPAGSRSYKPTNKAVEDLSKLVSEADGVVFVSPEYNHSISGILKNALDSLSKEWKEKPAAFVGYGWYKAQYSHAHFKDINDVMSLDLGEKYVGLQFGEDINEDGSCKDESAVESVIDSSMNELLEKINK